MKDSAHTIFSSAKANHLPHCRINVIAPQINSRIPPRVLIMSQSGYRKVVIFLVSASFDMTKNGTADFIEGWKASPVASEIFPTIQIPFNGRVFPAPRCPRQVLAKMYGQPLRDCCVYADNHRTHTNTGSACVACRQLASIFRIVRWRRVNSTHAQQLVSRPQSGGRRVRWEPGMVVEMPDCGP